MELSLASPLSMIFPSSLITKNDLFISFSRLVGNVEVSQLVGLFVCTLNVQPVAQLLLLEELLCQVLEVALLEGDAGFYKKP